MRRDAFGFQLTSCRRYDRPITHLPCELPARPVERALGWGCVIGLVVLAVLMAAGVVR